MFQRPVTDIRIIRYARNWPVTTTSNDKVLKMLDKAADNHNFDFNIGHLVKSPCKACPTRENFPGCMEDCELLDQIQSVLSDSISSANNYSVMETFDVPSTVLDQIWSVTGLSRLAGAGCPKNLKYHPFPPSLASAMSFSPLFACYGRLHFWFNNFLAPHIVFGLLYVIRKP